MILEGKKVAEHIIENLKKQDLFSLKNRVPGFAIIQIGSDPASEIYIKNKKKIAHDLKYHVIHKQFRVDENFNRNFDENLENIKNFLAELNHDDAIDGIILQLPVPEQYKILKDLIKPEKDVDGLGVYAQGCLALGLDWLRPCTPLAVIKFLDFYNIKKNVNITIVGRSNLVGKPLAFMLLQEDATVQICHSKTENLEKICQNSKIIMLATGKSEFFSFNLPGAVIIDIGITKQENKLTGDFDFHSSSVESYSPVPGGIGPVTVACLMENVAKAYCNFNL